MEFGLNFFPSCRPDRKSADAYYREAIELCELADRLGYRSVKAVEHYFTPYGGYSPSPLIFLTAVAQRTRHVRLVTGAVVPAFNHPLKLAAELAMVDCISGGRLDAGFGRAFLPHEFEAFDVSMDDSRARFEEGLSAVQTLWRTPSASFDGVFHSFKDVTLLPRPIQQPHPPIYVAVSKTTESFVWSGERGYGLMVVPHLSTLEDLAEQLDGYRRVFESANPGMHAPPVSVGFHLYMAETVEQARAEGRVFVDQYLATARAGVSSWAGRMSDNYVGYEKVVESFNAMNFDQMVDEGRILVGTPDSVTNQVEAIRRLFGSVRVELNVMFGDIDFERAKRSVSLFGRYVLPACNVFDMEVPSNGGVPVSASSVDSLSPTGVLRHLL